MGNQDDRDEFDIKALRVSPERLRQLQEEMGLPPKPARKAWRRVSTTVPREWEVRLWGATRIGTYRLALELLYRGWRARQDQFSRKGEPILVSQELVESVRLPERSARNALYELERLGLIAVVRRHRLAPRVTLLHV